MLYATSMALALLLLSRMEDLSISMVEAVSEVAIAMFSPVKTIIIRYIQGVPKGTDTFKSFLITNNWITSSSFFHISKVGIKYHFINNFGKIVNLSFNG